MAIPPVLKSCENRRIREGEIGVEHLHPMGGKEIVQENEESLSDFVDTEPQLQNLPQQQVEKTEVTGNIEHKTIEPALETLSNYENIAQAIIFGQDFMEYIPESDEKNIINGKFIELSLIASLESRNIALWELNPQEHSEKAADLLFLIHSFIADEQVEQDVSYDKLSNQISSNLLTNGFNPLLVNYDFFLRGLGEVKLETGNTKKTIESWEDFVGISGSLESKERMEALSQYRNLLKRNNPKLSSQLEMEERSKLTAHYQVVLSTNGLERLGNTKEVVSDSVDVKLSNKLYSSGLVHDGKENPPEYYETMMTQLLSKQTKPLNVPLCPVVGGCNVIPGKDLGDPVQYEVGGLHKGVDYYPTDSESIIAPLDMWIVQGDGSSGMYGENLLSGKPIGQGEHVVIGYFGDFNWDFEDSSGKHKWVGDVFANFGHVEASPNLHEEINRVGKANKHQALSFKTEAGKEMARMGSGGYGSNKHLHFETVVSWRLKDGVPTENPNHHLDMNEDERPPGLRYIKEKDGTWRVQTGDIFELIKGGEVPLISKYQWPFGNDIEYIKFRDTYTIQSTSS